MQSSAVISECGVYRYHLQRIWDDSKPRFAICMLNGSTANANEDDPTIRRCIGFGKAWGFGGLDVVNEYGLRSTNPKALWSHSSPIGRENDYWIKRISHDENVKLFVCAWGRDGHRNFRDNAVMRLLFDVELYMIGNADYPRHPLYLKGDLLPILFRKSVTQ